MLACECALPSHQAMHSKIHQARFDYVDTCRRVEEDQADAAINQLVSVESVPIGDIEKPPEGDCHSASLHTGGIGLI
jgi:hypothetical protein